MQNQGEMIIRRSKALMGRRAGLREEGEREEEEEEKEYQILPLLIHYKIIH